MKYDLFISYSRKDSAVVDDICEALNSAGIVYFRDTQGISLSQHFPVVLSDAICSSKMVLFVASKNSYESSYTNKEIAFAYSEQIQVLPYLIDNEPMPRDMRFMFSNVNYKNLANCPISPNLVEEILALLGKEPTPSDDNVSNDSPNRDFVSWLKKGYVRFAALFLLCILLGVILYFCGDKQQEPIFDTSVITTPPYEVGDYYNAAGLQGVVFEVDSTGFAGKILSLKEGSAAWSVDKYEIVRNVGAQDQYDGEQNMKLIKDVPGWHEKYPAFAWCASMGEGWYLPAESELDCLAANGNGNDYNAVKERVEMAGGDPMPRLGSQSATYWSSTEGDGDSDGECYAQRFIFVRDKADWRGSWDNASLKKSSEHRVRAVAKFPLSTQAPYEVGDFYNENNHRGIVFEVDSEGLHGKAIYTINTRMSWKMAAEIDPRLPSVEDALAISKSLEVINRTIESSGEIMSEPLSGTMWTVQEIRNSQGESCRYTVDVASGELGYDYQHNQHMACWVFEF